MEKKSYSFNYSVFKSIEELDETHQTLVKTAKEAMLDAYCPYSQFQVGAAVLLEDGTIIKGNNQENAAYPNTLCAERVALFYTQAQFPDKKVKAVAVIGNNIKVPDYNNLVSPCGACRQTMIEVEHRQNEKMKVIIFNNNFEGIIVDSAYDILPFAFDKASF